MSEHQELLPTFEPTESDQESEMIETALSRSLDKKVEHSIGLIRLYGPMALKLDTSNGYQFGNSGGKDSCVVNHLLKLSGIKYTSTYNVTTIDPPPLIRFLREHHKETHWNRQQDKGHLILDRMVAKMSMPTRLGKWCCSEYKDCCSKSSTVGVVGVRIEESARRAGLWKELTIHNKTGRAILAPIAYWTEKDVWDFIHGENIPYCSLYDEGWSRLGCVGCPINPANQAKEFERWPKFEEMWKEGARRCWLKGQSVFKSNGEKYAVAKFESPDALYHWWRYGQKEKACGNCVFEEMMENV
jgi:phosphoadenosine phosphosulfate reductase